MIAWLFGTLLGAMFWTLLVRVREAISEHSARQRRLLESAIDVAKEFESLPPLSGPYRDAPVDPRRVECARRLRESAENILKGAD